LEFVTNGDLWPDIVSLLIQLDEIDPDFDKTLRKVEMAGLLSEQLHDVSDVDLAADIGVLVAGLGYNGKIVEVPETARQFLGAQFLSDNRGVGWLITQKDGVDVKTPANVIPQKAAERLPVLPELKSGISSKRLKDLVIIHDFRLFDKAQDTLRDLFEFTNKEAEVCQNILTGKNATQIAQAMNVTRETVKSHLKHIFQKTDAHSQIELVRILTQLSAATAIFNYMPTGAPSVNLTLRQNYISLQTELCKTRFGTNLYYSVCGDPAGRALVFFHSPLGSRSHWKGMALAAQKHGIKLYCFDRPGYGISDPLSDYGPESVAGCVEDLLRQNGHETADLAAYGIGGRIALESYTFIECCIENIYLYSFSAPNNPTNTNPNRQKPKSIFQKLNQLLSSNPHAVSAVWKILGRVKSQSMISRNVFQAYEGVPSDTNALQDRDFNRFLVEHVLNSAHQGGRAQAYEFSKCKQPFDFSFSDFKNVNITALFGSEDKNNAYEDAEWFLQQFPQIRLMRAPDQGQLLILSDLGEFLEMVLT
jgi:DNA-binding CsgD family transcriptional regulator